MNHVFFSLLLMIVPIGTLSAQAQTPSSGASVLLRLEGEWTNQELSTLSITSVDTTSGKITGTYNSPSGTNNESFILVGWANQATPTQGSDNVVTLTFSVQWGIYGSVTAWTGQYRYSDQPETISTQWHLARPNAAQSWAHVLTGSDTFYKQ